MCTSHDHTQGEAAQAGAGRRSFLRATALLGAAATAAVALPATAEAAPAATADRLGAAVDPPGDRPLLEVDLPHPPETGRRSPGG